MFPHTSPGPSPGSINSHNRHAYRPSYSSLASSSSIVSSALDVAPKMGYRSNTDYGPRGMGQREVGDGLVEDDGDIKPGMKDERDGPVVETKRRPEGMHFPLDSKDSTPRYRSVLDRSEDDDRNEGQRENTEEEETPHIDTQAQAQTQAHSNGLNTSTSTSTSSLHPSSSTSNSNSHFNSSDPSNQTPTLPPSPLTHQLFLANETVEHLARCLTGLKRRKEERERRVEGNSSHSVGEVGGFESGDGSVASLRELEMEVEARAGVHSGAGPVVGLGIGEDGVAMEEGGSGNGNGWMCCCDALVGETVGGQARERACRSREWRLQLEEELRLSGEIGQALLARYSALLAKHTSTSTRLSEQSDLLARAYKREAQLEKGAEGHLRRWREVVERCEGLERQLTQAQHSMTLSSTTLLSLRQELSATKSSRTHAKSQSATLEMNLIDLKRIEDNLRDELEVERRGRKEEERGRKVAERKVEELERRVMELFGEVEAGKVARERDGEELLANANETIDSLLHKPDNDEDPDVQRALGDLVADNTLLRHDVMELKIQLTDSRERSRTLEREVDDLRIGMGVAPRTPLEGEVHVGPDSSSSEHDVAEGVVKPSPAEEKRRKRHSIAVMAPPVKNAFVPRQLSLSIQSNASSGGHGRHQSLTPSMTASIASSSGRYGYTHERNDSLAPSLASNALSPRSSMAVAALGPAYHPEQSHSPVQERYDAAHSPRLMAPPSQFVRMRLPGAQRPQSISHPHRSFSMDRPLGPARGLSGVNSIGEDSEDIMSPMPASPSANDSLLGSSTRRKRTSFYGSSTSRRMAPSPSGEDSPDVTSMPPSATISEPHFGSTLERRSTVGRKPLMLQSTSSKAVQTEELEELPVPALHRLKTLSEKPSQSSLHSIGSYGRASVHGLGFENETMLSSESTRNYRGDNTAQSEASSHHDLRTAGLAVLLDQMSKLLVKFRQADVATLSKRLRRQHLAGDVGYLSQSTIKGLGTEVTDIKLHFKNALDEEKRARPQMTHAESALTRKDMASLLKLFKEVFSELVDLRGTINQVTLDPSLAQKLKAAVDAQENEDKGLQTGNKAPAATGALGWIAPISKLFATGPLETSKAPKVESTGVDGAHSQVTLANRSAPKLLASTSATTTHVNVEFAGGAGTVRRSTAATPAQHGEVFDDLPDSPSESISKRAPSALNYASSRPGPAITLGGGSTRGPPSSYKPSLMGIFAGASGRSGTGTTTASDLGGNYGATRRLRTRSSQVLGPDKDPAGFVSGRTHKRQISVAVDAVIDSALPEHTVSMSSRIEEEPIMQRTMRGRPRGLSDSSIRSTFVSHGALSSVALDRDLSAGSAIGAVPAMSRTTTAYTEGEGSPSGSSMGSGAASYWPRSNSVMRKLGRGLGVIPPKERSVSAPVKETIEEEALSREVTPGGHTDNNNTRLAINVVPPTVRSPSKAIATQRSASNPRTSLASGSIGAPGLYAGSNGAARSIGTNHLEEAMGRSAGGGTGAGSRLLGMFAASESVLDQDGNVSRSYV